ncbi:MAG TPA: PP2C family protein-serine/threonine phosphatase [Thermoplasmata archaeon]|nr:PP2C family protein-serine/threonine phosphatase [Thermoplasmata archaeon]
MLEVGAVTAQGRRDHMEDFVRVEQPFAGGPGSLYAAVFDGHGGDAVSRRASNELHRLLAAGMASGRPFRDAIREAFREFDDSVSLEPCGSTAAVLLLQGGHAEVANAGDSHALLVSGAGSALLTTDHRLSNEGEHRRVVAAGAKVSGPYACLPDGRGLMCTRSLGDREFRAIGILAEPDFASRALRAADEWIVLGSDGVWDGLEPEAVAALARSADTARLAAERIRDAALKANTDNVSVIAIRLP